MLWVSTPRKQTLDWPHTWQRLLVGCGTLMSVNLVAVSTYILSMPITEKLTTVFILFYFIYSLGRTRAGQEPWNMQACFGNMRCQSCFWAVFHWAKRNSKEVPANPALSYQHSDNQDMPSARCCQWHAISCLFHFRQFERRRSTFIQTRGFTHSGGRLAGGQ